MIAANLTQAAGKKSFWPQGRVIGEGTLLVGGAQER
jgi:hypothetical protein